MGPPKTRRRRSGTAVQYDGFFFKLVSKHPDPVQMLQASKDILCLRIDFVFSEIPQNGTIRDPDPALTDAVGHGFSSIQVHQLQAARDCFPRRLIVQCEHRGLQELSDGLAFGPGGDRNVFSHECCFQC